MVPPAPAHDDLLGGDGVAGTPSPTAVEGLAAPGAKTCQHMLRAACLKKPHVASLASFREHFQSKEEK